MNPWDPVHWVVIDNNGWSLVRGTRDGMGGISPVLWAETFEDLMRRAITGGYLRPPVAIKMGELTSG